MARRRGIAVVVDAARDVLTSVSNADADKARSMIDRWFPSPSPLLRRLAVNGIREASWLSEDEKLIWLLDHDLLYDASVKHETFQVLAACYPVAGDAVRRQVVARVRKGMRAKDNPKLSKDVREYERYNLLNWLAQVAPDDDVAQESFRQEQARRSDFSPREDPDLVVGEVRPARSESSMTVEGLLGMRVGDVRVARKLVDYRDDALWYDVDRFAFLDVVAEAAAAKPNWGIRLARALGKLEAWQSDLWRGLAQGWARASADERTWTTIFDVLANHQEPHALIHEADRLLVEFIQKEEDSESEAVKAATRFSDVLWTAATSDSGSWALEGADWLTAAINEPGGKIVEFWIRVVSLRARADHVDLIAEDRVRFALALSEEGPAGQAGRILLASQFHFLLAIDRAWTVSHLLPLFSWEHERTAEQAWDGFLSWSRLNEAVIEAMLPMYIESFPHLEPRPEEWRRKFTDHLAAIAVRSSRSPLEDAWLVPFVTTVSADLRAEWASHVAFLLRSLEPDGKRAQWDKWIKGYWVNRLSGVPRALAAKEAGQLAAWAVSLEPIFHDAVELLAEGPPGRPTGYVYDYLEKTQLPENEPGSVLKWMAHVLREETEPFYPCHYVLSILGRVPLEEFRVQLEKVVNQLVGVGCDGAIAVLGW